MNSRISHILTLALNPYKVRWTSVAPPKLARDTPVLDTFQPTVPFVLGRLGIDREFSGFGTLDGFLREGFTIHPPLGLEYGFNDVTRFTVGKVLVYPEIHRSNNAHAQTGICIGLSVVSTYKPASFKAVTTATLAWKRFIPFITTLAISYDSSVQLAYLESWSSVLVESTIIIQDVDDGELVSDADFVIVEVVSGSNLHGTGTEFHVDDYVVSDDRDFAVNERVFRKFPMEMLMKTK